MVRWGVADIGKKANSEYRGAKEGRGQSKSLSKVVKIGEKLPSNCRVGDRDRD